MADVSRKYVVKEGNPILRTEFEQNLALKMKHTGFLSDLPPLLRPGIIFNTAEAHRLVEAELLFRLGTDGKAE